MISQSILQPVVALLILNTVMLYWMYVTRVPAIAKAKLKMDPNIPTADLMNQLPANVRWKADNYNHLLEAPTMFYAVALTLALIGEGVGLNTTLAWLYVGLRIVHSLVQALWNKIMVRFYLFVLSSIVLTILVIRAAIIIL